MDSQSLDDVKAKIRSFRSNGWFSDAAAYVDNLPQDTKHIRSLVIEIAQLYLVQGQLRLAAKICDDWGGEHASPSQNSGLDSEAGALELLRAFIGIARSSKLKTALRIAQSFGRCWRLGEFSCKEQDRGSTVQEMVDMTPVKPPGSDDDLDEYRVLLEFYYWKIHATAAEQGLLDEKETKGLAAKHLSALRKPLQLAGRLREARYLLYLEADMMESAEDSLRELEMLSENLRGPQWITERALTLTDIGERQLKSKSPSVVSAAQGTLQEAEKLFESIGHGFGLIDVALVRVTNDHSISAGERFAQKTMLADAYFETGHFQNGIRCLAFAISPEMAMDLYVDEVTRALRLLENKIEEAGSEMLKQVSLLHSVLQAVLKTKEYGFALQSLETYYAAMPEEIGPKYHTYLALTLATAYGSFGDYRKALKVAEEGFEIAPSCVTYDVTSDAALRLGITKYDLAADCSERPEEARELMASARALLIEWANRDRENNYVDGEVQKCLVLAGWENLRTMNSPDEPAEQPWIERIKSHIPDSADAVERSQVVDMEVRMLMRQRKYSESLEVSSKFLEVLNKTSTVHPLTRGHAFLRAAMQGFMAVMSSYSGGQQPSSEIAKFNFKRLCSALDLATKALTLFRSTDGAEPVFECTAFVWRLLCIVVETVEEPQARELLEEFSNELSLVEKVCDDMRRSIIPIGGLKSLMNKRLLVSKKGSLKLYDIGIRLFLRLGDTAKAWEWLQRGKARAFADFLGTSLAIPEDLTNKIDSDNDAHKLLREEQSTLEALREPGSNYVSVARHLVSVRDRMLEDPLLADMIKIRDGTLNLDLNTEDLTAALRLSGLSSEMVKFVDWYVPPLDASLSPLILFIRKIDGTTTMKQLSVTAEEVKSWIQRTFQYPKMAEPPLSKKTGNRLLQEMNGLVEGLSDATQENDLLILSPSGILHGVPLHALSVDEKPLICRNLVVYASSTATLRQCLSRSNPSQRLSQKQAASNDTQATRKFFGVYEEPTGAQERTFIYDHTKDIAAGFGGQPWLGPQVTRDRLLRETSAARWVHYHGHARYSTDDVLKSSLVVSNGRDLFQERLDDAELGRDYVSISDLFNAHFCRGGVHFTIIACDSGTQDIAPGDEPLGIVPALLHAGATSVLGCQWPIDSRAGRAFSKAFYEEIDGREEAGWQAEVAISLAHAMRTVIGKMKSGELGVQFKQAYYWAPFALHGLWLVLRSV